MHFGARAFGSSDGFPVHTPMGQMLSIEILGLGKRKAGDSDFVNCFQELSVFLRRGFWIAGGDLNEYECADWPLGRILQNHCGSLVAKGMCNPRQSHGIS